MEYHEKGDDLWIKQWKIEQGETQLSIGVQAESVLEIRAAAETVIGYIDFSNSLDNSSQVKQKFCQRILCIGSC